MPSAPAWVNHFTNYSCSEPLEGNQQVID